MKIVIDEGEMIPHYPWYLPAYDTFGTTLRDTSVVCYPIGIHLIVRLVRKSFHWYLWNIDDRLRTLTRQDRLNYANTKVRELSANNDVLRDELLSLQLSVWKKDEEELSETI